jgi:hypothetical protein
MHLQTHRVVPRQSVTPKLIHSTFNINMTGSNNKNIQVCNFCLLFESNSNSSFFRSDVKCNWIFVFFLLFLFCVVQAVAQFLEQYYNPDDLKTFQRTFGVVVQPVEKVIGPNKPNNPGIEGR